MACLQFSRVKLAVLLASCAPLASTCQQQWTTLNQHLPYIHIGQGKCMAGHKALCHQVVVACRQPASNMSSHQVVLDS